MRLTVVSWPAMSSIMAIATSSSWLSRSSSASAIRALISASSGRARFASISADR